MVLGVVFLILVFKILFVFHQSLWNDDYPLSLMVEQPQNYSLLTFEPKEPLLTILSLPANLDLEVPYGYGHYRAQALSRLEKMESRSFLALKTFQENLAVNLDGQIELGEGDLADKRQAEKQIFELFWKQGKTNLSFWDIIRLWWRLKSLNESDYKHLDLKKMSLVNVQKLPDKSEILILDQALFDMKIQKIMIDPAVRLENLTVEILNATDHPGLAERAARILTNSSLVVVSTGNSEKKEQKTSLEIEKKLQKTRTASIVQKIFNCKWQENKEQRRADLTLIVGEDYFRFLTEK